MLPGWRSMRPRVDILAVLLASRALRTLAPAFKTRSSGVVGAPTRLSTR